MKFAWNTVKIKDVASPVDRTEPPLVGVTYRQVGVRLWGKGAYERDNIDGENTKYKTFNRAETNDIIINKIWARNGSVSVINENLNGCYCSSEFPLFKPDTKRLNPKWFYWITKCRWFWETCDKRSRGTSGKNRIKPQNFLDIDIPLPPIETQEIILSKLSAIQSKFDDATSLRETVIREMDALLQSVFSDLVKGVDRILLSEVAPIIQRTVELDLNKEYKELGTRSFGKGTFHKPILSGLDIPDWQKYYRVHSGDLIFNVRKSWEGSIAHAKEEDHMYIASHNSYMTCVPDLNRVTPNFLSFYFKTEEGMKQVIDASRGSADRNKVISMGRLKAFTIPIPTMTEQLKFRELQNKVERIKKAQKENETELEALMPSILDKAFKGELI